MTLVRVLSLPLPLKSKCSLRTARSYPSGKPQPGVSSPHTRFLLSGATTIGLVLFAVLRTSAQIAATAAFDGYPACSDVDLSQQTPPDIARITPEWKPIVLTTPPPTNPPTILEGFVAQPPAGEKTSSQAKAEVSEEEVPWNHMTHDFTTKIVPDKPYQYLLSSWTRFPGYSITLDGSDSDASAACSLLGYTYLGNNKCQVSPPDTSPCPDGTTAGTCTHIDMEVEWENASDMHVNDDNDLKWGALPQFAYPALGDRVWVEGRWIFDCGHTGVDGISHNDQVPNLKDYVQYETEIHPPRALVTFRLNHPALTDSNSQSSRPASWLPVTGSPVDGYGIANGPTSVPVTEADIFISGNGGGANDICNLVADDCSNWGGHSGPWIPVNDRNYVFDIYPPGTDYNYNNLDPTGSGKTFKVTPPVANASLQWRIVDKSSYIPEHTCGMDSTSCVVLPPDHFLICLLDDNTAPPDQSETSCPATPLQPTRIRVILKFAGTTANYFAQSILLGWDDVPAPPTTPAVRTFQISLHKFIVEKNGETFPHNGDWRVFVHMGGQWRYMSSIAADPDTDDCNHSGTFSDNSLTGNEDEDCYSYDGTPWIVSIQDGQDIYAAVGGFESDEIDSDYCPSSPDPYYGCNFDAETYVTLFRANDDRIGTLSLKIPSPYTADQMVALTSGSVIAPPRFTSTNTGDLCTLSFPLTCDELQFTAVFSVAEVLPVAAPVSGDLKIGDPHYGTYVSSSTPFTLSSSDPSAQGFQYRFNRQGDPLPIYSSSPFPVHWTNATFPASSTSVDVYLSGLGLSDGNYDFQYSANSVANLLEPRHTTTTVLDNTPPVATITQPTATQYTHADILTLSYVVSDGTGSGVKSSTPEIDGSTTLPPPDNTAITGSGQQIPLLLLSLGTHTFSVVSVDNLNNAGTNSVTFTIIVTAGSMQTEVNEFLSLGCIDNAGIANALASKMGAVQNAINNGQFQAAINIITAFIHEIQAQAGKHISTTCTSGGHTYNPVQILLADAQYLISTLPHFAANPIMGSVFNSTLAGVPGATVSLLNSSKALVTTAVTDVTGFYYFDANNTLTKGKVYTVKVTVPTGYKSSSPSSQSFTWTANAVTLPNFTLK